MNINPLSAAEKEICLTLDLDGWIFTFQKNGIS